MTYNLPTIDIKVPPGFMRNGTSYEQSRRWVKGNLVRFYKGSATPIGGWRRSTDFVDNEPIASLFADPTVEAARNCYTWRSNNGGAYTAIGTNLGLYIINPNGVVDDITPIGFAGVPKDGGYTVSGYGAGFYGAGYPYGTPPLTSTGSEFATDYIGTWSFDNWGEDLVATVTGNLQPIYSWTPGDPLAVAIPNAPANSRWISVTDQRILMSVGDSANIRLVEWSDSEDREDWTAAANNQAGGLILPGTGRLIRSINIGKDMLIIGEMDVYLLRYLGPPYIFGQDSIDTNFTIVGPAAATRAGNEVFWMGDGNFWVYSGGSVSLLPCDVMDYLNGHIDFTYRSKTQCFTISQFSEVWWLYQSKFSLTTEPDSYIVYNYKEQHWSLGKLDRTCGTDKTQFNRPLMVASDGLVYDHELPNIVTDPDNTFIETGMFDLGGNQELYIGRIYPDVEGVNVTQEASNKAVANSTLSGAVCSVIVKSGQTAQEFEFGPYDLYEPTPMRANGKFIKLQIAATADSGAFKVGVFKLEDATNGGNRGR